jgi:hypothetical protein
MLFHRRIKFSQGDAAICNSLKTHRAIFHFGKSFIQVPRCTDDVRERLRKISQLFAISQRTLHPAGF